MEKQNSEYYKTKAAESRKNSADSFNRCDTDGFVSQHCHDLNARLNDAKARLAANNWHGMFPGLYDLKGNRVRAKLINGRFGQCWAILDDKNKFTGLFVNHPGIPVDARIRRKNLDDHEIEEIERQQKSWKRKATNLRKKGYQIKMELAPADAKLEGSGRGLSGLTKVFVYVYRTDPGYPQTN